MQKYTNILLIAIFSLTFLTSAVLAGAPDNDNFNNATPLTLSGNTISLTGSLNQATLQPNEPKHAGEALGKSVWYKYTPLVTGVTRIGLDGDFSGVVAVYTGSQLNGLNTVGYSSYCGCGSVGTNYTDLLLNAGETYHIAVDYSFIANGVPGFFYSLSLTALDAPAHDNVANALDLGYFEKARIAGTNFNATREAGETDSGYSPLGKSVWYRWKPNQNKSMSVEIESMLRTTVRIYSTSAQSPDMSQLVLETTNSDSFGAFGRYHLKFFAKTGKTYYIMVDGRDVQDQPGVGNFQLKLFFNKLGYSTKMSNQNPRTSLSVFRPSEGRWYTHYNLFGTTDDKSFGLSSDLPMPADYNGDGATDYAVIRTEGDKTVWYIANPGFGYYGINWGLSSDRALTGDFDGDGRADQVAVRQTAQGLVWYIRQSADGALKAISFGLNSDRPFVGDFDGDGYSDVVVLRQTGQNLVWYVLRSGVSEGGFHYSKYSSVQFGLVSDTALAEDFDGDGKTDHAVYRSSTGVWYILRSKNNQVQSTSFGQTGDVPQPADFDGDGKADLAVFRPSAGNWYFWHSGTDTQASRHWGKSTDIPVSTTAVLQP